MVPFVFPLESGVSMHTGFGAGVAVSTRQLEKAFAWPIICERENGQKLDPVPTDDSMIVSIQGCSMSGGVSSGSSIWNALKL